MPDLFAEKPKQATTNEAPPEIVDYLGRLLERHQAKMRPWPEPFPEGAYHAARFWVEIMEPPHEYRDRPEPRHRDGRLVGWSTPYHDRLKHSLAKFLTFNTAQQVWIIEHIRRGVPWRGEDGKTFAEIIKQSDIMRTNPAAYIGKASAVLRGMKNG